MNTRMNTRWMLALLLVLSVFMSFSVTFAQDEDGDTSTATTDSDTTAQTADDTDVAPEPAGVGEVAKAADNFSVAAVPTPEQAQTVLNSPPAVSALEQAAANFDEEGMLRAMGVQIFSNRPIFNVEHRSFIAKRTPPRQTPSGEVLTQLDDPSGAILTVFSDYSLVAADAKGEVFFEGYIAGDSVESLIIVGEDTQGTQYALSHGDVFGLTAEGDVFLGSGEHLYYYDYDEDGNFVSLTDSDGNEYDVAADEDGNVYITDADGNTGEFYADGSYDVYDAEGNVFDEGALFGDNDNDVEFTLEGEDAASFDEGDDATSFDENSDEESVESGEDAPEASLDENTDDQSGSDTSGED